MRVAVVGATGLIGRRVATALSGRGDEVVAVVRSGGVEGARSVVWDGAGPVPEGAFDGCHAVVNVAGAPIGRRWNDAVKREMVTSRVDLTDRVVEALDGNGPRVLVSGSAVGYYGQTESEVDESAPAGTGFLADLCVRWEAAAMAARDRGARVVTLRSGIVLTPEGGALEQMLRPARLGMFGPVAGGRQWLPWIHADDEIGLILRSLDDAALSGPVNAVAPGVVRQGEFAKELGRALGRPASVPTPGFAVKAILGEGARVILQGQRVVPRAALAAGYEFAFPELGPALADLI